MQYTTIDIETANSDRTSICAIGLAKFKDGVVIDTRYSLINPGPRQPFNYYNTRVHGINQKDITLAPFFDEFYPEIMRFIGRDTLIAHNASFDMRALHDSIRKQQLEQPDNPHMCSMKITKRLEKLKSYKLDRLVGYYHLPAFNHHNALDDAIACGRVLHAVLSDNELTLAQFTQNYGFTPGTFQQYK